MSSTLFQNCFAVSYGLLSSTPLDYFDVLRTAPTGSTGWISNLLQTSLYFFLDLLLCKSGKDWVQPGSIGKTSLVGSEPL